MLHLDLSVGRQLRARRALLQLEDVPLRTRRALLLYKVNGDVYRPSSSQRNILDLQYLAPFWLSADEEWFISEIYMEMRLRREKLSKIEIFGIKRAAERVFKGVGLVEDTEGNLM